MAVNERIAKLSGHRVEDKHCPKPEDKMLSLADHLLKDSLLSRHLQEQTDWCNQPKNSNFARRSIVICLRLTLLSKKFTTGLFKCKMETSFTKIILLSSSINGYPYEENSQG